MRPTTLLSTLRELEDTLATETDALRALDTPAIEAMAKKKESLNGNLRAFVDGGGKVSSEEAAILKRARGVAQSNQLLIVHARSCIRDALALVTGEKPAGYGAPRASKASAVCLDMRG
jgi:hypothetical protein